MYIGIFSLGHWEFLRYTALCCDLGKVIFVVSIFIIVVEFGVRITTLTFDLSDVGQVHIVLLLVDVESLAVL